MIYVVCIPGFYGGKDIKVPEYGGAGYEEGIIACVTDRSCPHPPEDPFYPSDHVFWSDDFINRCGVYRKALRSATRYEIEAYHKGIKNINEMNKKFTISFVSNGSIEKIDIYNKDKEKALEVLDKMLSTEGRRLEGINYVLEE